VNDFQPGDRVRVVLDDVQVQGPVDDGYLTVNVGCDEIRFGLDEAGVTVTHELPAIEPGDVLTDREGGIWFAQRYFADFDDPEDWKGCNKAGWRVVLVPLNGGPYGSGSGMRPEEANERFSPFRVVHHEDEREQPA
jgi:hypothetical protein